MAVLAPTHRGGRGSRSRALEVGLAVACGLALVGFVEGTRPQTPTTSFEPTTPERSNEEAVPGQSYLELRARRYGPNHRTTSDLAQLRETIPSPLDPVPTPTDADRVAALATRSERRAFAGAPPVVPHPIDEQGSAACLACHAEGLSVEGRMAPAISHPPFASCTQCHVPSIDRAWPSSPSVANQFVGVATTGWGTRAWEGAPPTMPHRRVMREQCASCHGVTGLAGLRTTHPDRHNCEQCHAPTADVLSADTPW